jgi:hypothetical protein
MTTKKDYPSVNRNRNLSSRRAILHCNSHAGEFVRPLLIIYLGVRPRMFLTSHFEASPVCQLRPLAGGCQAKRRGKKRATRDRNLQHRTSRQTHQLILIRCMLLQVPPTLMIIPKINLPSHLQIRRDVRIRLGLFRPPPISQPREPIARLHIRVLPIFPSRLPSHPCDMGGTAWPQAMDPTTWPSAVGPRTAILAQNCSGEEGITIFDKIVCRLLLWGHGCDVLVGDFA